MLHGLLQSLQLKSYNLNLRHHNLKSSAPFVSQPYYVHPSAYIDEPCTSGAGTKIWHFCHVMPGARLGERCILGQNVHIANDVVIGNNVKIQNNVSVYTDHPGHTYHGEVSAAS